ncbi:MULTISPECIES: hypothetical protein [unclassified Coleofasciculus]|jgi:hypothetical protein|uniref:hypothetical protein n=2 Tax=Cyanobacteriota TaxID=1117 RepID=UPI0016847ADC|nr:MULTISPECIES: hypothetical protein [unclassified Coleofasciculus]MBD1878611.1 hypothetical protein [Coleofasciculus sp. FACHB-T130]MBD1892644.1 hypothetical protein [Coleofasciculus sp. FACHB-SPT9]MBD1898278.1 hypothetical protein [Coleofasciculus sp. FACHB-129]MBD1900077.1 hypothetical protein [Coleofasciculus sp. FACHB-125]MBD2087688.1 hypothetical protein [Coleofasciculus sp. FACHB-542]
MTAEFFPTQVTIEDLVAQIFVSRRITPVNQYQLQTVLLTKDWLDEEEQTMLNRLFYGVRHGLLKLGE